MDALPLVVALASSLAAMLAWVAKLRWSTEFRRAKDAEIELLKAEIQSLKELTPMRVREYFLSVKEQLEEYNDALRRQLEQAAALIRQKDREIELLRARGHEASAVPIEFRREELIRLVEVLRAQLQQLAGKHESASEVVVQVLSRFPHIDRDLAAQISATNEDTRRLISTTIEEARHQLAEDSALWKLAKWLVDQDKSTQDTIIPDHLFQSSSYGEAGVNQVTRELMLRKGWIEAVDGGFRITDKGRQAASSQ